MIFGLTLFLSIKIKNIFFGNFSEMTDLILFMGGFLGFFIRSLINILFEFINLEFKLPINGGKQSSNSIEEFFNKPLLKGNPDNSGDSKNESIGGAKSDSATVPSSEYVSWDWDDLQDLKYQVQDSMDQLDPNSKEYQELKSRLDEMEEAMDEKMRETTDTANESYSHAESSKYNENKDTYQKESTKYSDFGHPKSEEDLWKEDAKNFSPEELAHELNKIDDMINTYENERVKVPAADKEVAKLENKKAIYLAAIDKEISKEPEYEGKGKGIDYGSSSDK